MIITRRRKATSAVERTYNRGFSLCRELELTNIRFAHIAI